jgi:hypothetical protein
MVRFMNFIASVQNILDYILVYPALCLALLRRGTRRSAKNTNINVDDKIY